MTTRTLLIFLIAITCVVSCKKKDNQSATGITLAPLQVSGNTVTLNWSRLTNNSLMYYTIVRVTDSTNYQTTTLINVDYNITQYKDSLPMSSYVRYTIVAKTASKTFTSNEETYARSDKDFISLLPKDALYDRSSHRLYIYSDSGDIVLYDVQNKKIIKQITTGVPIGYCDIGTYNGKKELYVPRSDGRLFIYDAATLVQTDQIFINNRLQDVCYNNGILYVYTDAYHDSNNIVSYNRTTKVRISTTLCDDYTERVKVIPGSNTELLSINEDGQTRHYKFDNNGVFISQKYHYLPSSSSNYYPLEFFPDASKFINTTWGIVYDTSQVSIIATLSQTVVLTSFDFDNINRVIYAGTNKMAIQAYSMDNYQLSHTIFTIGYPAKVFYDNGSIISVSTTIPYQYPDYSFLKTYTFIEQF